MDSAISVLADLRSLGVELVANDQVIRWRPAFLVSERLKARILARKNEIGNLIKTGHPTARCPACTWPLDAAARCVNCFDRRCVTCGCMTGSYFILRCLQCGMAFVEEGMSL
jgi:hypothetical protein